MPYIILALATCIMSVQGAMSKQYSVKAKNHNATLYVALQALSAMLAVIAFTGFRMQYDWSVLPYSIGFGVMYFGSSVCMVMAVKRGPFALSSLISAYSQMIPTLYGIIFWQEPVSPMAYVGMGLLVISIFLINSKKEEFKFSVVWLILISISFLANGLCATVSQMQQKAFEGLYKAEYMAVGLLIAFVGVFAVTLIQSKGKLPLKECAPYALPAGAMNAVVNMGILFLIDMIPSSVLFPCLSAGGVVLSFIIAVSVYKERLTVKQTLGFILGVLTVIALNM